MANSPQARKRIRTAERRTAVNRARRSRIRTSIKRVEAAILAGDKSAAETAFSSAMPEMHRGVTKGVFHKNTISRKLSRLSANISSMA